MKGSCCMDIMSSGSANNGNGLGQLDILNDVLGFVSGLFGKDPEKTEYDRVRQQAWDSLVAMVDHVDTLRSTGDLSKSELSSYIDALTELMRGFQSYTTKMYAVADKNWIEPRFHDYYDHMAMIRQQWLGLMNTLPTSITDYLPDIFTGSPDIDMPDFPDTPVLDPVTGQPTYRPTVQRAGFDTTSMLLIGGVIAGLVFMSRKRG